ncbi:unnamed protein product [Blepharisma stoltei]|uniref:TM2 domain-containing protein n=1 Tax=Blepharisma stoltei TaxID=1481888 RepID=A0AAU9KA99_9CILI|nr:unnamed protein product [Blepharisma stoltei]
MNRDRFSERCIRLSLMQNFRDKKLPFFNDRLDWAYEEMIERIRRKDAAISTAWILGLGSWYWYYVKPHFNGVKYLGYTLVFLVWASVDMLISTLVKNYYTDINLENKILRRYLPQVIENNPKLECLFSSPDPQGESQTSTEEYEINQIFNGWVYNVYQKWNINENSNQIGNLYEESPADQDRKKFSFHPEIKEAKTLKAGYSETHEDQWTSKSSCHEEKLWTKYFDGPFNSKCNLSGSKIASKYINDLNNHYIWSFSQDNISAAYYPGVSILQDRI